MADKNARGKSADKSLFWADQIARDVLEREKGLGRVKTIRTEMGMGASGIPHVGSAGDGVRSYVVNLALKGLGAKSEFIAFSDDRDGLRKIPIGFTRELEKDIGKPVSMIKDPYGCHKSFGEHISSLLMAAFEKLDVKFELKRASIEYAKGTFDKEIVEILSKAGQAGEIIKRITGQEKYLSQLPFLPICKKCGSVYTTTAYGFDPKAKKIQYKCDQDFIGKNVNTGKDIVVKGCGHEGECGIRDGKLAWKVEFAARWRALKINYEAYGKDILESVRCNDAVCREMLGWEPPIHSFYEMFTERGGKKISKSGGNVFTPDMWMRYASPESLRLLFLKRLGTTRVVDLDSIPAYMDEVDGLASLYFGRSKTSNEKELQHMKRLYEYVNLLGKAEDKASIPYNTLVNIMKLAKDRKVAEQMLIRTGHAKGKDKEIGKRLVYAENWLKDSGVGSETAVKKGQKLSGKQKTALKAFAAGLAKASSEDDIKNLCFDVANQAGIKPQQFFSAAYLALLGQERGPRLAPFILAVGKDKVIKLLKSI